MREHPPELRIFCKAWPVRNGPDGHFPQTAFALDWASGTIRCPASSCTPCPLRARCTGGAHGRSVTIRPSERLLQELPERSAVEHSLARIGQWQGRDARYIGRRKNLFDLRRTAAVHNLH